MSKDAVIRYYRVKGSFPDQGERVQFARDVRSITTDDAKEKIFVHFGSKHRIKRNSIKIQSISEIKPSETLDSSLESLSEPSFKYYRR